MKTINERFKEYRIYLNITQKQLSEKTGVSISTIKKFENGADIRVYTLENLLDGLGLSDSMINVIPDVSERPSYIANEYNKRKRAGKVVLNTSKWKWGDEE